MQTHRHLDNAGQQRETLVMSFKFCVLSFELQAVPTQNLTFKTKNLVRAPAQEGYSAGGWAHLTPAVRSLSHPRSAYLSPSTPCRILYHKSAAVDQAKDGSSEIRSRSATAHLLFDSRFSALPPLRFNHCPVAIGRSASLLQSDHEPSYSFGVA